MMAGMDKHLTKAHRPDATLTLEERRKVGLSMRQRVPRSAQAEWTTPAAMLQRWRRGECLLSPPTAMTLQSVEGRSAHEAPARLAPLLAALGAGHMHPIYFAPEVQMVPLTLRSRPS